MVTWTNVHLHIYVNVSPRVKVPNDVCRMYVWYKAKKIQILSLQIDSPRIVFSVYRKWLAVCKDSWQTISYLH